jgi:hypothetical protein
MSEEEKNKQQDQTNLITFEQESKVLDKTQSNLDSTASNIQEELFKLAADMNISTFLLGSKLLEIQNNEIYKQWWYSTFTVWLTEFSKEAKVKTTKLWDSKKIVKMLEDTSTKFSEVNHTSTKGLYQIARIHKNTNDDDQAKKLIEQLSNEDITVTKLRELAKDTIKPSEIKIPPVPVNNKKSIWVINTYQRVFISLLPIACVIFYITEAF